MKKLAVIFVTAAFLINAMAPTLAHAATYLQGTQVNANTLIRDAYVQVTYRDHNGQEKTERGWIDAVGDTSFTIRSGHWTEKTIAYGKVLSVIMSEESAILKQMSDVNQLIRDMGIQLPEVVIMSREQIDSSKITKGWYAHVIYTSEGEEETVTGKITRQDSVHIVIRVQGEHALKFSKTIAYGDIDTLVISQHVQSIEAWKNPKQVKRHLKDKYNAKVRVQASSIWKSRVVGRLIKMTPDTLVISRGGTFFQVPVSSISNFEVNIGQHRNTGKGMAIGLGVGAGIFYAVYRSVDLDTPDSTEGIALLYVLGYISIPICVISTLIGATIKSDKWVEVSPQRLNLSIAPTSTKGLRAALTFNF